MEKSLLDLLLDEQQKLREISVIMGQIELFQERHNELSGKDYAREIKLQDLAYYDGYIAAKQKELGKLKEELLWIKRNIKAYISLLTTL